MLEQFIRNRTTVIITHRMAILALADRIVVMQGGPDSRCRHATTSCCRRSELYSRLYSIQFKETA